MTKGDYIALVAVALNALVYLSGLIKLNTSVGILSSVMRDFKEAMKIITTTQSEHSTSITRHETEIKNLKDRCDHNHSED